MKKLGILFILLIFSRSFCISSEWEVKKDKNGIKVSTRSIDGSDFKEYFAVTIIDAQPQKVAEVILRVTDYVNWLPDCEESKILKRSEMTFIVYQKIDCPWPTLDRDAVTEMKLTQNSEKKVRIEFKEVTGYKKEVEKVVRVKKNRGYWQISQFKNKSKVTYQCLADPGGKIPAWVVNMFVVDAPYKTLLALRKKFN